jgi:hypothetical protein
MAAKIIISTENYQELFDGIPVNFEYDYGTN